MGVCGRGGISVWVYVDMVASVYGCMCVLLNLDLTVELTRLYRPS